MQQALGRGSASWTRSHDAVEVWRLRCPTSRKAVAGNSTMMALRTTTRTGTVVSTGLGSPSTPTNEPASLKEATQNTIPRAKCSRK